ncbi:hypothetical protein DD237_003126 [Peronospora effusa]|uniref:Uncharacterized protein n=1 Tax=Peronospora effusa TaxID=542832 RepID=A0A3R7W7I1_9STRA|nr:hypothetical protein DD237_003126 [Peronospora effusa]
MEIQDMLSTYDIKQFVLADAKSASRLVAHILNQVSRPTALTDAMLLIDVYSDLLLCDCAAVQICCRNMIQYLQRMDIKRSLAGVAMTMEAFAEVKNGRSPNLQQRLPVAAKRQREDENGCSQPLDYACHRLQQDDGKTRLIFDLNQFASVLSIDSRICNSLITQCAAQNAARFSRELFSRRLNTRIDPWNSAASVSAQPDNLDPAEALKKVAISLSFTR